MLQPLDLVPLTDYTYTTMPTHPLNQNDQTLHGNTYGEGRVLGGQQRHCICINASRGLSATAEFLVNLDHVSDSLIERHWLPFRWRIQYNLGMLMHGIITGSVPNIYINQPLRSVACPVGLF